MGKDGPPEEAAKAKNLAPALQSFASVFADVADVVLMVLASSCVLEGVEAILQDTGAPRWTHAPQRTATEQKKNVMEVECRDLDHGNDALGSSPRVRALHVVHAENGHQLHLNER